jgi:pimeloyl-ACP methyl ester carboxylesterase
MKRRLLPVLVPASLFFMSLACRAVTPPPDDLPAPKTTTLFGQKIVYYDFGTGPTVVLLHGLGSSAKGDWGRCMLPLSAHHRVLALDQLGFGGSDKPFIDYGIQTWVDFLGEFLREQKPGSFTLAGESLGGWIAAQYTIQALSAVQTVGPSFALPKPSRLVLSDAAGHLALARNLTENKGSVTSLAGDKAILSSVFYGEKWRTDDAVRDNFAWSMAKGDTWTIHSFMTNPAIQAEAVDGKLGAITIPTLVVWGDHDGLVPLEDGRDYAAKIPGSRLVIVPDCGHAPCIEDPPAFLAAMVPFVEEP